jgi:hypothetical protein
MFRVEIVASHFFMQVIHYVNRGFNYLTCVVYCLVTANQIVRLYSRFTSLDKSSNGYLR